MNISKVKYFTGFTKTEKNSSTLKLLVTSCVGETYGQLTIKKEHIQGPEERYQVVWGESLNCTHLNTGIHLSGLFSQTRSGSALSKNRFNIQLTRNSINQNTLLLRLVQEQAIWFFHSVCIREVLE